MRVFISIELPKKVKDEIFEIQKNFNSKNSKIKFVAKKNLHITLKWLGEVKEDKLDKFIDKLGKIKFERFEVNLENLKNFKRKGITNTLYIELEPNQKIIKLQQLIDEELLDIFSGDQMFMPHLTIGRVKLIKKIKEFENELKNIVVKSPKFNVKKFNLIESKLTKDGPLYRVINKFNE